MNYMGSQGICYKHSRNHPGGCHHPKNGYVKDQISFKLLLLTFKALHGLAPIYISELIKPYNPSRSLRSSTLNYLSVPKSNTATYGDRCFSVATPKLWNSLPGDFRYIENLCTFKTSIKTWLFKSAFDLT